MNKNNNKNKTFEHRRELIKLLATSPLLGSSLLQYATALDNPALLKSDLEKIIQSPEEALNLFDFHRVASQTIPTSHYGYLTTGVDDDRTKNINHEAYRPDNGR